MWGGGRLRRRVEALSGISQLQEAGDRIDTAATDLDADIGDTMGVIQQKKTDLSDARSEYEMERVALEEARNEGGSWDGAEDDVTFSEVLDAMNAAGTEVDRLTQELESARAELVALETAKGKMQEHGATIAADHQAAVGLLQSASDAHTAADADLANAYAAHTTAAAEVAATQGPMADAYALQADAARTLGIAQQELASAEGGYQDAWLEYQDASGDLRSATTQHEDAKTALKDAEAARDDAQAAVEKAQAEAKEAAETSETRSRSTSPSP